MSDRKHAVTVLSVDDQEIFRRATRELIAATDGFEQVGEAASGPEAIAAAAALRPDLILLDVRMPGMDGFETARRLAAGVPESTVVLVSLEEPPDVAPRGGNDLHLVHLRKQDLSVSTLQALWGRIGGQRDGGG